ncbi:MAG: serine acetyltransferase, partial [Bacilli bacterium]|nr:serine acetyltransferase [Bacilli bacterium]
YELDIPYIPRIISETVHSKTGIDIHPGAKIGSPFFIDHGTGIVVGETAEIGKRVKIYHGVTLGALSLKEGRALSGKKRHPTIKDNVTIYSGASILGGDTVIGDNVTIGSNVFIVNSVVEDTTLIYTNDSVKTIK